MKKNYEDEVITTARNTAFILVDFAILYALYLTFGQYLNGEFGIELFLLVGIVCLVLFVLIGVFAYLNIHNVIENNNMTRVIKSKGIKINGRIIDIKKPTNNIPITYTYFKNSYYYRNKITVLIPNYQDAVALYHAVVEYEYNGERKEIISPRLNFNPEYITDNVVDVYLYDDKYYIDNYKVDFSIEKKKNLKELKTFLLIIFLMFLFFIGIVVIALLH